MRVLAICNPSRGPTSQMETCVSHGSTILCPRQETCAIHRKIQHSHQDEPMRATRDAQIAPQWPSVLRSVTSVWNLLTTACATPGFLADSPTRRRAPSHERGRDRSTRPRHDNPHQPPREVERDLQRRSGRATAGLRGLRRLRPARRHSKRRRRPSFTAGADVTDLPELWRCIPTVGFATDKPIIAATFGWCVGGGIVMVMMCDLMVSAESTVFYYPRRNSASPAA